MVADAEFWTNEDDEIEEFLEWLGIIGDTSDSGWKNTERRFRRWHSSTQ